MPKALFYAKHYTGYGHTAGSEASAHAILRILADAGWETSVLLAKHHPGVSDYTIDGIPVKCPKSGQDSKNLPFQMFPGQDLILTQLSAAGRAGILASQFNIPSLHLVHNDHLHNEHTSRKWTDLSIYNTEWVKNQWSLPGMVLHPVVNPHDYRVEPKGEFDVTLVNLSRGDDINYNKGYATFYELARRMPHLKFLGVKGAYGNQHVEQLDNVTIWEHQKDMRPVYEASKVIIQPSEYESYGRVPIEGFASGLPAVVTPLPGVREAVGGSMLYAEFGDYDWWESHVDVTLQYYDDYSKLALDRSGYCWERSQRELDEFLTLCEILAVDDITTALDYLEVPV